MICGFDLSILVINYWYPVNKNREKNVWGTNSSYVIIIYFFFGTGIVFSVDRDSKLRMLDFIIRQGYQSVVVWIACAVYEIDTIRVVIFD